MVVPKLSKLTSLVRDPSPSLAILAVADLLDTPGNPKIVCESALKRILEVLDLRHGNIRMLNQSTGLLELMASRGFPSDYKIKYRHLNIEERSSGKIVRARGPVLWDNIEKEPACAYLCLKREGVNSILGVPLVTRNGVVGTLTVGSPERGRFGDNEIQILSAMGRVLGVSVENAGLLGTLKGQLNDLTKLTLRLEESHGIKNRLLSVIQHELRTPITVILSNAELLTDGLFGEVNDKQRNSLLTMRASGARLLFQVENALDIAQLEGGTETVHPEPFDVNHIRSAITELLGDEIERKHLDVLWEIDTQVPSLFTDRGKVTKVFRNVIDNAIKFTEKGRVTIRTSLSPEGEGLLCEIEDTGTGIPAEQFDVIFDPFHQVDSSHTRLYGGMGLDLRYVKKTLDLLGGGIKVKSEVKKGTCFTFWLPLHHGEKE